MELIGDSLPYLVVKIEGSEGLDEGIYRVWWRRVGRLAYSLLRFL